MDNTQIIDFGILWSQTDKTLQGTEVMQNLLNKLVYDKYTGNYGFQN